MTIHITLSSAAAQGAAADATAAAVASETLSSAGAASTTTAQPGQLWTITAEADLFVQFGAAPTGVAPRWRMKAGDTRQWFAASSNEKVSFATS